MVASNFRLGLEYLIPFAFVLFFASGPIKDFLYGSSTSRSLSTHEVPRLDTEKLVFPEKDLLCPEHTFQTHYLSTDPLLVYIPGFLSEEEADHLVKIR